MHWLSLSPKPTGVALPPFDWLRAWDTLRLAVSLSNRLVGRPRIHDVKPARCEQRPYSLQQRPYVKTFLITVPLTSVSRSLRPLWRYVSRV